jgi:hypothetical protein
MRAVSDQSMQTALNILVSEGILYLVALTRSTRGYPSNTEPLTHTRAGGVPALTRTRLTRPTRLPAGVYPRVTRANATRARP